MRYQALFTCLFALVSGSVSAQWKKINDLDYTWGPFKIYNISLFTETGDYNADIRPLMLTLKYDKPVDGRDFAISIARSWSNLGISLKDKDNAIDRLRKTLPDLKPNDSLSYIALPDKGYFVLNDQVIPEEFYGEVNNAIVAIWLDPKVDLSEALTTKKRPNVQDVHIADYDKPEQEAHFGLIQLPALDPTKEELKDDTAHTEQAVDFEQHFAKAEKPATPAKEKAEVKSVEKAEAVAENVAVEVEKSAEQKAEQNTEQKAAPQSPQQSAPQSAPEGEEKPAEPAQPANPDEPEKDIQPITDPLPENIRAS